MNLRIAVCDDSAADASYVAHLTREWADRNGCDIQLSAFSSAEEFLFEYDSAVPCDILLLDIEMGEMDGVALARRLRRDNETMQIVFVTGYSDYISEGYDVSALHYLMKPVNREKLSEVLSRAAERIHRDERMLALETADGLVRVPLHEIRFLDVQKNYVTIHARQEYTVRRSLNEFERELDERFCRVGRAMIVNIRYVQRVTKTELHLSDDVVLPVPRGAYELLNRAIIKYT